jgi:hypothetical protein
MDNDTSTPADSVVTRLTATLQAHAITIEPGPPDFARLRQVIRRSRRRATAACAAGLATLAVAGGLAFTSYGATGSDVSSASDPRTPWSGCAADASDGGRRVPIGATKARLTRATTDYRKTEGGRAAKRLLENIVCQVDHWAHGSDGLEFRVMWRGTFTSGATGVVLRVARGDDAVDFLNTSYGRRSHPAVATEGVAGPSWLIMQIGGGGWEVFAPPGSRIELYEEATNAPLGTGVTNADGYVGIFAGRPVAPSTPFRAVTVDPSGTRRDGPFPWKYGAPEECRVLFRSAECPPDGLETPPAWQVPPSIGTR